MWLTHRPLAALLAVVIGSVAAFTHAAPSPAQTPLPVNPSVTTSPDESNLDRPLLVATAETEKPSDKLLVDTLTTLAANHAKLALLHIAATTTWETFLPTSGIWELERRLSGEVYLEPNPPFRSRHEVTLERTRWEGPDHAPYMDEAYTDTWDGAEFRRLSETQNPPAVIAPQPGGNGDLIAGSSLLNIMRARQRNASKGILLAGYEFDPFLHHQSLLSARRVTLNGSQPAVELHILRLTGRGSLEDLTYWFDPAHNLAFLGRVQKDSFTNQLIVHTIVEAAPNLFFPQSATTLYSWPTHPNDVRLIFTAARITANEPTPPNFFTLAIPPNTPTYHAPLADNP